MAKKVTYLIRRLAFGHQYTIHGFSPRGAMTEFFCRHPNPAVGEDFVIKERSSGDWIATYRWLGQGSFRKVADGWDH